MSRDKVVNYTQVLRYNAQVLRYNARVLRTDLAVTAFDVLDSSDLRCAYLGILAVLRVARFSYLIVHHRYLHGKSMTLFFTQSYALNISHRLLLIVFRSYSYINTVNVLIQLQGSR